LSVKKNEKLLLHDFGKNAPNSGMSNSDHENQLREIQETIAAQAVRIHPGCCPNHSHVKKD